LDRLQKHGSVDFKSAGARRTVREEDEGADRMNRLQKFDTQSFRNWAETLRRLTSKAYHGGKLWNDCQFHAGKDVE
jgi:hypothetical protein